MGWIQLEQYTSDCQALELLASPEGLKNNSAVEDKQQLTRTRDQEDLYFIITPVCQIVPNTGSDNVERCISIQIYFNGLKFTKLELDHILEFRQLISETYDFTTTITSGLKSPGEGGHNICLHVCV